MARDHELLLNFHDAVIYGSDLKLLEKRDEWLNDSCIHFFFTLLQERQKQRNGQHQSLLFMDPSVVSFWMHQCTDEDEIEDFVKSTPFPGKRKGKTSEGVSGVIFIAVNDSMAAPPSSSSYGSNAWKTPNNGNHWSLLVVEVLMVGDSDHLTSDAAKSDARIWCWHFDSVRNSGNLCAAEDIAHKIRCHVYPEADIESSSLSTKSDSSQKRHHGAMVQPVETPQQRNGYDCGVHAVGAAEILSEYYCTSSSPEEHDGTNTNVTLQQQQQKLEECLRTKIHRSGSEDFCATLRLKIASEIRRLQREEDGG